MAWWHYLFLVNIYLTLFFGFYALLLRRETFFQLNRIYLVGAALLSFFIPLIQAEWVKGLFITQKVQYAVYGTGTDINITSLAPLQDSTYTLGEIAVMIYLAGVIVLALRLMWQFVQLRRVIKQAVPSAAPYSFFNKINVAEDTESKDVIIAHEEVHAQQWHSADVLIIEAVMIINWFNPVVYLYRFSIKHIHEYIADRQAIKAGNDKAEYALLLLSQTFNAPAHQLVNPFYNHSLLKQRIMMLQKSKSQRIKLLKYGLSAPLFILMLVLSSATISNSKAVAKIHNNAEELFLQPATDIIIDEPTPAETPKQNFKVVEVPNRNGTGMITVREIIDTTKKTKVYTEVDEQPRFPGGDKAFYTYVANTIRYPKAARENNIQGRVIVSCVVEKTGEITDVKVLRGIGYGADEEAIRAIKQSPKWIPGKQKGIPVRVAYAMPVAFSLNNSLGKKDNGAKVEEIEIEESDNAVFTSVEQFPAYKGGNEAMALYLQKNVKYPTEARKNKIQGRVIVNFLVKKDGSVADVKIMRGIGYGADEEAARVIKAMPKWNPGMQNGRPVTVQYTVPVAFSLAGKQLNLQGRVDPATQPKAIGIASIKSNTYSLPGAQTFIEVKGSAKPLYVLNGKEVGNIDHLDPKEIESISVLKDASATSLYGDKAKNGVVLVTTKKAK